LVLEAAVSHVAEAIKEYGARQGVLGFTFI
jgi:hypothetical protein